MGVVVKIEERAAGDEGLAASPASGEEEGDVGDLFGQGVDGAIDPDDLLIGVGQQGTRALGILASKPGCASGGGFRGGLRWGARDVETEEAHREANPVE